MAQFEAFDEQVEVRGDVVLSLVNVMGAFKSLALGILSDHGIDDPQGHQWYSQQAWLDSFRAIADQVGPNTLYQIGRQIPEQAEYPPGIGSIEEALSQLDAAYRASHRGGEVGHYRYLATGLRSGRVICDNPYPCDFDRGLIDSLARHFEPIGSFVDVSHDELAPCKKHQGDSCTFVVKW